MNRLKYNRCYLAGPMDRVADGGVGWRQDITPFLRRLGIQIFDPTDKPIDIGTEDAEHRKLINQWKIDGRYDDVTGWVKTIRAIDLRMVDLSDFIIAHVDIDVHMCGTFEEIFWANRLKRPILIHCQQGVSNIPSWLFGVLPHQFFFGSWKELKNYISHINSDYHVNSLNRWIFFDYERLMGEQHALCA